MNRDLFISGADGMSNAVIAKREAGLRGRLANGQIPVEQGTLKILLADDETDLVETYARLLRASGYCCLSAYDGRSAMALADAEQPALLITDLNMPVMDGFELTRWFRNRWPQAPIIAITAFHTPQNEQAAIAAGANAYLRKPFGNAELIDAIRLAFRKLEP
jgi:DNA-binding response OmpR family regulator